MKAIINFSFWMVLACSSLYGKAAYIDLAYGHMNQFAKTIKRTECIDTFGTGGSMLACVRELSLSMSCKRSVDVEEARRLCLVIAATFCSQVNDDKVIRPYLKNFPFTVHNMYVGVLFGERKAVHDEKNIDLATISNGFFKYKKRRNNRLEDVYVESYEEALQKNK